MKDLDCLNCVHKIWALNYSIHCNEYSVIYCSYTVWSYMEALMLLLYYRCNVYCTIAHWCCVAITPMWFKSWHILRWQEIQWSGFKDQFFLHVHYWMLWFLALPLESSCTTVLHCMTWVELSVAEQLNHKLTKLNYTWRIKLNKFIYLTACLDNCFVPVSTIH